MTRHTLAIATLLLGVHLHLGAQATSGMLSAARNARATVQKATAINSANIAAVNAPERQTPAQAAVPTTSARHATRRPARPSATDTVRAPMGSAVFGTLKGGKLDTNKVITIRREAFQYASGRKRDPFVSLLATSDIRPVIGDLRITGIAYDPRGTNSVAILRDVGTKEQYRGKVGSQIGRMRIVRIAPKAVTFMIEEFGFSRQETLSMSETAMSDTTVTRTP